MLDKLVLDKYLWALPYEMKKMVSMQNPQSLEELLTAVEIHQNTQDLLRGARAKKGFECYRGWQSLCKHGVACKRDMGCVSGGTLFPI